MPSLPPPAPARLGDALTAALSRLDGCPNACDNTETPRAAVPVTGAWRASYLCSDCGTAWTTDWKDD